MQHPRGGRLLVWADNETVQNTAGNHATAHQFQTQRGRAAIVLSAPDGTLVDSVPSARKRPDRTEGRYPDGTAGIRALTLPTPVAANALTQLTELDARRRHRDTDFHHDAGPGDTKSNTVMIFTLWLPLGLQRRHGRHAHRRGSRCRGRAEVLPCGRLRMKPAPLVIPIAATAVPNMSESAGVGLRKVVKNALHGISARGRPGPQDADVSIPVAAIRSGTHGRRCRRSLRCHR